MLEIREKKDCCGCGTCVAACPKQCISLQADSEGFLYPIVNTEVCINCGLCEKECPIKHPYDSSIPIHTYAAINKNEQIRQESSSGGIFTLLAERIINEDGVVFGARFDEDWQVVLDYTETIAGLAAFRGSKYVQARTGDSFIQCANFLKTGRRVMFSGTPCQIAGLKHFLRKDYENLLLVDFVCHGVPSPKVWSKYLQEVTGNDKVIGISMRDKLQEGWKKYNIVIDCKKGENTISFSSRFNKNDYMNALLHDMILRPSCYACKAKECRSHSDITIADFWGIQNIRPQMDDDKGTSLVMINSAKGDSYMPLNDMKYEEVTFEEGYRYNSAIYRSAKPWFRRSEFFVQLDNEKKVVSLIRKSLKPTYGMLIKAYARAVVNFPYRIVRKVLNVVIKQ